ncbi:Hypothetical predicted protein [Xyrichtys novacula]|uniref:Uncharacterized protein n=1 Tax=Xyrichtys novacula TaxID=13765 RepID=A0AAV1EP26_XYRNO|nr:Hypothetical predicted protein [Xyrichtys novacula]
MEMKLLSLAVENQEAPIAQEAAIEEATASARSYSHFRLSHGIEALIQISFRDRALEPGHAVINNLLLKSEESREEEEEKDGRTQTAILGPSEEKKRPGKCLHF